MYRSKISSIIAGLLFFSFLNWNCTKIDTTTIGSGLIPGVDNVNTFDTTIKVIANNFDTVGKDCPFIYPAEEHVLGYISNDPYFGKTTGIIYTELMPAFFPYNFPKPRVLDSVVLVLSYKRTYGDSTVPQKVNVYELQNRFNPDSSTCSSYPYNSSVLLGSTIYTPQRLKDTVKAFRDTSTYQLRIKLSNTFGQNLLLQDSSTAFASDSLFRTFFKGFAIVPDVAFGGNALTYYNLTDSATKLAIYMRSNTGLTDTSVIYFRLTDLTHSSNNINRNHTGAEIAQHVAHPSAGDSVIYIQTTPGTYAEIRIPALSSLSNRIIHKAQLIMDQVYSSSPSDNYFYTPDFLYLELKDTATGGAVSYRPIPCDFNVTTGAPNLTSFGGFRTFVNDPSTPGKTIARYTFDISRYVQKIVTNKRASSVLKLSAPDLINITTTFVDECGQIVSPISYPINALSVGRVKLGGGNSTNYQMKLRIIYSTL